MPSSRRRIVEVCYSFAVTTPSTVRGAGGTPGGVGQFFIGLAMAVVGAYMLLNQVQVTTSFWNFGRFGGFGPTLVPLLIGVAFLFYDGKSIVGMAAHGPRLGDHPGCHPDEHGHLLPSDLALQYPRHARAPLRRPRPAGALAPQRVAVRVRDDGLRLPAASCGPLGVRSDLLVIRSRTAQRLNVSPSTWLGAGARAKARYQSSTGEFSKWPKYCWRSAKWC